MKKDVYQMVTDRIIEQLEKDIIPWHKPWSGTQNGAYNRFSNRPYSLLNQMILKHSGEYGTYKQWSEIGGHVRKGETAEIIVFWKFLQKEVENENGEVEIKQIPYLRYYNVFHISQIEGVEPKEKEKLYEVEPIEEAEKIKQDYIGREHLVIKEKVTDRAFYSPSQDYIEIPCKEQYQHIEEYYSTLFHEAVHSTGHKSRLDRLQTGYNAHFGSETYSKEELTAEMGSAMILNIIGIETEKRFKNSSAYIKNWLQVLKNDNKFIVSASGKAEKAVKYILGENDLQE